MLSNGSKTLPVKNLDNYARILSAAGMHVCVYVDVHLHLLITYVLLGQFVLDELLIHLFLLPRSL